MDVGSELRRARQARGLSLGEVAGVTKISHGLLCAIECNDFEHVPGGLFARGYLRAYAQVVGLDPQPIVERYRAEFEPPEPPEAEHNAEAAESIPAPFDVADDERAARRSNIVQFCVVLVIALAYLASLRQAKPSADGDLQMPEAAVTVAAAAETADARPVGTSGWSRPLTRRSSSKCVPSVRAGSTQPSTDTRRRVMNAGRPRNRAGARGPDTACRRSSRFRLLDQRRRGAGRSAWRGIR